MRRIKQRPQPLMEDIMLTADRLREVVSYNPETGHFTRKNGEPSGSISDQGYIRIKIQDRSYQAHRLAWLYMTGKNPVEQIDHINGDRLNNKFSNLREASRLQNNRNSVSKSYVNDLPRGVAIAQPSGRFKAYIRTSGKQRHLGTFDTPEEASEFYQLAADLLHGEFAYHRGQGAANQRSTEFQP